MRSKVRVVLQPFWLSIWSCFFPFAFCCIFLQCNGINVILKHICLIDISVEHIFICLFGVLILSLVKHLFKQFTTSLTVLLALIWKIFHILCIQTFIRHVIWAHFGVLSPTLSFYFQNDVIALHFVEIRLSVFTVWDCALYVIPNGKMTHLQLQFDYSASENLIFF